ncbi:MAG TPA: hypothetical protein VK826_09285 [Bacteroidia bacterium]|nr:hypothetical protein [Bacteroidia bacterium]
MRTTIIFLLVFCSGAFAQNVRTDTVKPGYYIPLDSNVISCKVAITPNGKKVEFINTQGNRLPDSLVRNIGKLAVGSVVVYGEITVLRKGILEKAGSVRYVIGNHNSVSALKDPSIPDTLPAAEIAGLVLDVHVYQFDVTYSTGGAYYVYTQNGNGISPEVKERIAALPSGTRVWFESVKRKEDDGTLTHGSAKVYVVK